MKKTLSLTIVLAFTLFSFVSYAEDEKAKQETTKKDGDVVLQMKSDDGLPTESDFSYTLTIARLMLYYDITPSPSYLQLIDKIEHVRTLDFGSVDARMDKFVNFSKHEGRSANLKIKKLFCMRDSQFRGLVRKYNGQAKRDGTKLINLRGQNTHWYIGGVRKEFLAMNKESLMKARAKNCARWFVPQVKKLIARKTPVVWGIGTGGTDDGHSNMFLIVGYNDTEKEIIYLGNERNEKKRMGYKDAWTRTMGVYTIRPRVNKKRK
ncbi:MAG: hypothetical protein GXP32_08340 [Kiritimatiellaeota bacterium]|nr:hypothetical protein [Kiritimatiellota bacterium]